MLTFCHDPTSAKGLAAAKRRPNKCFAALRIRYIKYDEKKFLICHDGIDSAQGGRPAAPDRLSAQALGINTQGKPWGQPGTALYKWDGAHKNLVMVFVRG